MADDNRPPEPDEDATKPADENPPWPGSLDDIRMTTQRREAAPREIPDFPADCRAGDTVGDYRLVRRLSSGGFGTVFLAERVRPFAKEVALKVIRSDRTEDPRAVARFDLERRLLAQLDHPNIATLLDGGNSVSGQMFLVMEYVHGDPITIYCDQRKLDLRTRLSVFLQLCEAIQHAHGKGVIHRDLSPRNVLVADGPDGGPVVKVIDFGLAKSRGDLGGPRKAVTEEEYLPGTPGYASPEQFEPGAARVDVRSDIYSLGAILYELLSGAPPHDPDKLRSVGWAAIGRFLRQQPVRTPSDLLSTLATGDSETAQRIASMRQERLDRLAGTLKAELEWIPLQALRPEQPERYQTVQSLAQDIRNYLGGFVLQAAPESRAYRARKFILRHRSGLLAAAVAVGALAATTLTVSLALVDRSRALAGAREREAELNEVLDFQAKELAGAQAAESARAVAGREIARQFSRQLRERGVPDADRMREVAKVEQALAGVNYSEVLRQTIREAVVLPSIARIEAGAGMRDRVRALLLLNAGRTLAALGFTSDARQSLADTAILCEELFGAGSEQALQARLWLANTDPDADRAEAEAARVAAMLAEAQGNDSRGAMDALRLRRDLMAQLPAEEKSALELAQEIAHRSLASAPGTPETIDDQLALGWIQSVNGQPLEARTTLERALSSAVAASAPPEVRARALHALGTVLVGSPDPKDTQSGLDMLREAAELAAAAWGTGHPTACWFRGDLASGLVRARSDDLASVDEALRLLDVNLEIATRLRLSAQATQGDRSNLATVLAAKAVLMQDGALLERAVAQSRDALRIARTAPGLPTEEALQIQLATGIMVARGGHLAEAETLLREAIERRREVGEEDGTVEMLKLDFELARVLRSLDRRRDAADLLLKAQDAARARRKETSESRWYVSTMLLDLLEENGSDAATLEAQRAEVERLRSAATAAGQHSCQDWRRIPGPPEPTRGR